MRVNNPNIPKFPLICNNEEELINNQKLLNRLGYVWRHRCSKEEWRTDFLLSHYPVELRLFIHEHPLYKLKEITIHKNAVWNR